MENGRKMGRERERGEHRSAESRPWPMAAAVERRDRNHDDGCDVVDEICVHPESGHAHVRPPEDAHSYTTHTSTRKKESPKARNACLALRRSSSREMMRLRQTKRRYACVSLTKVR